MVTKTIVVQLGVYILLLFRTSRKVVIKTIMI